MNSEYMLEKKYICWLSFPHDTPKKYFGLGTSVLKLRKMTYQVYPIDMDNVVSNTNCLIQFVTESYKYNTNWILYQLFDFFCFA